MPECGEEETRLSETDTRIDDWESSFAIAPRLERWWSHLQPAQREAALSEVTTTMPTWLAHDLLRAKLPLKIQLDPSVPGGAYHTPPEVQEFLEVKRQPEPKRRFWQRKK
jgi:hypothetical protein